MAKQSQYYFTFLTALVFFCSCTMDLHVSDLSGDRAGTPYDTISLPLKEDVEASQQTEVVWDSAAGAAYDSTFSGNQIFDSSIRVAAQTTEWSSLSWQPLAPYQLPLPNNNSVETYYNSGNADMSGNLLLLHMDEATGASSFTDGSGYGFDGSCSFCPQASQGIFGGALEFSSAEYIEISHQPEFLIDEGTVSLWFYPIGSATEQGILSKDSDGRDTGGHMLIHYFSTNPHIWVRIQSTSSNYSLVTANESVTPNQWNHLSLSFGPAGIFVYLNGQLAATNSYTGGLGTSSGGAGNFEPFVIGAATDRSGNLTAIPVEHLFEGKIDEVALFDRQMTDSEIEALYLRGALRIKFQVRSCQDATCSTAPPFIGPTGLSSSYFSEENRTSSPGHPVVDLSSLLNPSKFFQFRVIFESDVPTNSPFLHEATINP